MLTVFTPTYNRAYILSKLYKSLCSQTSTDFEWIVVDDGSTDGTHELLQKWQNEEKINIKYIFCSNGGKHRAINKGVKIAQGNLFFIVDSDDYLTQNAIESIITSWGVIKDNDKIAGLCYRRINYLTGNIIGRPFPKNKEYATTLEIIYKWGIKGDKAEIFRTDLMKENPFPEIEGEKFMTEAYIWNKIAGRKKLYCIEQGIYMCNYLSDGLTASFMRLLRNNPKGYIKYYQSLYKYTLLWTNPIDIFKITIRLIQSYFYRIF